MQLLRDIALFVEVVNTRSFVRAAANLEMPPSTLSRRISGLEKSLGLPLLTRTTRRVDVTDAGAAYFARCAHLVEEARVAHEQLAETVNVARGTLRAACSPDFATLYLAPMLTEFTKAHPLVDVELTLRHQPADVTTENLDLALRIGDLPESTLVAKRVATLQLGLYAAPSYFEVAGEPAEPEDLYGHMCIRMRAHQKRSNWQLTRDGTQGKPKCVTVPVTGRFVVSSVSMIRQLTLLGGGIGIMDNVLVGDDLRSGRLLPVLPDWRLPPVPVHMLTASRHMPARTRLFGEHLTEWFSRGMR